MRSHDNYLYLTHSNPTENLPRYAAKSYDIQASPTLSRRPPMKNNNNTFEMAEQRKYVVCQLDSSRGNAID